MSIRQLPMIASNLKRVALLSTSIRNLSTMGAQGPIHKRIPPGDSKPRLVCDECNFILYKNPLIVAGVVAYTSDGRILLCRRNIEPRKGYIGLPAGFMECDESVEKAAAREAFEEADTKVQVESLLAVYSVPRISQVHMFYRAKIDENHVSTTPTSTLAHSQLPKFSFIGSGPETIESMLYEEKDIPWNDFAFPSGREALKFFLKQRNDKSVDQRVINAMPPKQGPLV